LPDSTPISLISSIKTANRPKKQPRSLILFQFWSKVF
jgi:hypothetical protein